MMALDRPAGLVTAVVTWLLLVWPPENIAEPLYVVLVPMRSISALIDWNSESSASRCERLSARRTGVRSRRSEVRRQAGAAPCRSSEL